MEQIKPFLKKYNFQIGLLVLLLMVALGVYRGITYSEKINQSSKLTYATIYNISEEYYSYFYWVGRDKFEGMINNSSANHFNVGDEIIIQYSTDDPIVHIIYSTHKPDLNKDILKLPLKEVKFWDAW